MCYLGCVDETPNFPHFDLAQGPHTFLYGTRVNWVTHAVDPGQPLADRRQPPGTMPAPDGGHASGAS